jgi:hypothetical protein
MWGKMSPISRHLKPNNYFFDNL